MDILYQHVREREIAQAEAAQKEIAKREAAESDSAALMERLREVEDKLQQLMEEKMVADREPEPPSETAAAAGHSGPASLTINGDNTRVLQMDVKVYSGMPSDASRTRNFCSEDIEHIDRGDVLKILKDVTPMYLGQGAPVPDEKVLVKDVCEQLVTRAAMLIFSDPSKPQNITCYLPKPNSRQAMTHGEDGWTLMPTNLVFPPMVKSAINVLFNKQPYPGMDFNSDAQARAFGSLMTYLANNEGPAMVGAEKTMRPILVRNTDLLQKLRAGVGSLPSEDKQALTNTEPTLADLIA